MFNQNIIIELQCGYQQVNETPLADWPSLIVPFLIRTGTLTIPKILKQEWYFGGYSIPKQITRHLRILKSGKSLKKMLQRIKNIQWYDKGGRDTTKTHNIGSS
ncbi:hypothetical protein pb186bvf_005924 [Paramecium bursaria]